MNFSLQKGSKMNFALQKGSKMNFALQKGSKMNFSLKAGRKIYESKITLFLGMRPNISYEFGLMTPRQVVQQITGR